MVRTEFDVFLSHNSREKPTVELVANRLVAEAHLRPFLDAWHLVPGESWIPELADAIEKSATVAVFVGESGESAWHIEEMQLALVRAAGGREDFRVIPVLLPGSRPDNISPFLRSRTWVDFRKGLDDVTAFQRLVCAIKGEAPKDGHVDFELPDDPAPYVGLRAFGARESRFFFGREAEAGRLIDKLRASTFVAVVGASGSGKSSLVRAGVLPKLQDGAIDNGTRWRTISVIPGSRPLEALARAVCRLAPSEAADENRRRINELTECFAAGENGLYSSLVDLEDHERLLLLVDQFEEVFSHTRAENDDHQESHLFLRNIAHLATSADRRFRTVITIRADFIPRCLEDASLRTLLEGHQLLLGPLDEAALRQAIERPAREVGAFFEKGLVRLILEELGDPQGALPLLQDALYALWSHRSGPWLTHHAYEQLGGVPGALRNRAESVYASLSHRQRQLAKEIILRLTNVNEGLPATRRRARSDELYLSGIPAADIDRLLETLSGEAARLLITDGDTHVVAHDALYEEWPTLRDWLSKDREALRTRAELVQATAQWTRNNRVRDYLWRGKRLRRANRVARNSSLHLATREREFLRASNAQARRQMLQWLVAPSFLLAALAVWWWFRPQPVAIRVYDEQTGELVHQPFHIAEEYLSSAADDAVATYEITANREDAEQVQERLLANAADSEEQRDARRYVSADVTCPGFYGLVERSEFDGENSLLKLYLRRHDLTYANVIAPDTLAFSGLPTDDAIERELKEAHDASIDPSQVTLLVRNRTDSWVDVILRFHPPSTNEEWTARDTSFLDVRDTLITVRPGGIGQFDTFALEPGFFLFLVSTRAETAKLVESAAVYQDKYCVLELEGDPISARKRFASERPSWAED